MCYINLRFTYLLTINLSDIRKTSLPEVCCADQLGTLTGHSSSPWLIGRSTYRTAWYYYTYVCRLRKQYVNEYMTHAQCMEGRGRRPSVAHYSVNSCAMVQLQISTDRRMQSLYKFECSRFGCCPRVLVRPIRPEP